MNKFDDFLNSVSDSDKAWWPLLAVRPAKDEKITGVTIFSLTPLFGTLPALGPIFAYEIVMQENPHPGYALATLAMSTALFYLGYQLTFARSWNRRAQYLNSIGELARTDGEGRRPDLGGSPHNTPIPFRPVPKAPKNSVA